MVTDRTGLRVRQIDTPAVVPRPATRSPGSPSRPPSRSGPTRMCVGCRSTDSWSALLRVVAVVGEDGARVSLAPDPAHRLSGRGAWLHPTSDCLGQAVRRRAFVRALRLASGPDVGPVAAHLELHSHDGPPGPPETPNRKRVRR
ncbi:MAG: YlxR family protein [Lapillicoccus sp.]